VTLRLCHLAVTNWADIDGYAAGHGMPELGTLSIERFCNFVMWLCTRNSTQTERDKFRAKVWMPPKGQAVTDDRSPWSAENEAKAFASVRAMLQG
jgi:hypothetical protein